MALPLGSSRSQSGSGLVPRADLSPSESEDREQIPDHKGDQDEQNRLEPARHSTVSLVMPHD